MGFDKVLIRFSYGFNEAFNDGPDPPPPAEKKARSPEDPSRGARHSVASGAPGPGAGTGLKPIWTQNRKLKYVFVFRSVFGRFLAKVGPRKVPNGPGLKNAT